MARSESCPVCGSSLPKPGSDFGDRTYYHCPRCGLFGLTHNAESMLPDLLKGSRRNAAVLSYAISRTQPQGRDTPLFNFFDCERIIQTGFLPTPQEQAENLIRWLGDNLPGPGEGTTIAFPEQGAFIGARSEEGFLFIVQGLIGAGLVKGQLFMGGASQVDLTFEGWSRYEQLRRGTPSGRKAFMAMEYKDPLLDRIVNEHFRPAVAATGFVLKRLDDEPPAGLIDDRLRVEIQSARFLIVDLTHQNLGAYWEAGYAEGLGKPVIYTCDAAKFEEASHFDTNHHLHVLWKADAIELAVAELKTTIRATIPEATREE